MLRKFVLDALGKVFFSADPSYCTGGFMVKRMSLIIFCGLLCEAGSQAAMIVDGLWNPVVGLDPEPAGYEQNATLQSVTTATDIGFLIENLRVLGSCLTSAHCRCTGRAISWSTYDNSSATADTTNALSPRRA